MHKKEYFSIGTIMIVFTLVGYAFLFDGEITGHITKDLSKGNVVLGFYSFQPNFKVQTGLDFFVYDSITKDLKTIISCVEFGQSTDACVSNRQFTKELQWEFDCDKGEQRVFYDIAKLYDDCMKSADTNCLCSASFGEAAYIARNSLSGKVYEPKLLSENTKKTLSNEKGTLSYELPSFTSQYSPLTFTFRYDESKLNSMFSYTKDGANKSFLSSETNVMLLKQTNGEAIILELVGKQGQDIVFPNGVPIQLSGFLNANPPACSKPKQNIERFCVTDPRKKYLVYDESEGTVAERPITIKFAAHLPDTPPAPIQNIDVKDMPKASKSVIVSWDSTTATDALFYKVYVADSTILQTTPTVQMAGKAAITTLQLLDATSLSALPTLDTCAFNLQTKKCEFGNGVALEKGKLYAAKTDGKARLLTVISAPEDGELAYSVTAVDSNGNEIDNVKELQKLPVVSGISVDDLPLLSEGIVPLLANLASFYDKDTKTVTFPSYKTPTSNIDGTLVTDFKDIMVYYKKNSLQKPSEAEKLEFFDGEIIPTLQDGKLLVIFSDAQQFDVYSFVVVGRDIAQNPKKSQFSIQEIGATLLELPIT